MDGSPSIYDYVINLFATELLLPIAIIRFTFINQVIFDPPLVPRRYIRRQTIQRE